MTTQLPISGLPMASVPLTGTEQVPMDQGTTTVRASIAQILAQAARYLTPIAWTLVTSPLPPPIISPNTGVVTGSASLFGIAFGNGLWVAIGVNGATSISLTSPDGIAWTIHSVTPSWAGRGIYFTNNAFFSIASGDLWRSIDGVTWTNVLTPADGALLLPVGFDGVHYAICETGTLDWYYSADGITWTRVAGAGSPDSFDANLVYGNFGGQNVWLSCFSGNSGSTQVGVNVNITSSAGWVFSNQGVVSEGGGENSIFITNKGAFLFDYPNSEVWVSYYGYDDWIRGNPLVAPVNTPSEGPMVTYGNGVICVVGTTGAIAGQGAAIESNDGGSTWSTIPQILPFPVFGDQASGVGYGNGKFIAVTQYGFIFTYTPPPVTL